MRTRLNRRWRAVLAATVLGASTALAGTAGTAQAANPPCYVNGDGTLYCGNTAGTAIYERAMYGPNSPIVDHLRSNPSWFNCYVHGEYHGGGNNVWYQTYGDDSGNWGFVPAVKVFTPQDPFPGVRHC